ncbi:hypothetical protein VFPPC_13560 [Pochonia chlamydosporia 170]|uniref:Uncharacterized protein n=1 Tax=Pochonia chlamydosporia 170 TaxID=1380566 RepID=A0A179FRF7_METCM|nr:hypothetical protein VFPPC_13560 [Pochonia chlamydosporia 170]OAQ67673.1 hypothetical protein VFPPC_13560 [Pochonia chlamydosporia 170]
MKSAAILSLLAATAIASPTLHGRTPSDKSGKEKIAYDCEDLTIPNPGGAEGQGEGGSGIFTQSLSFIDKDGKNHGAKCEKSDGVCVKCTLSDGLPSKIEVNACHFPVAGTCNIDFEYKGYHYDTSKKQPKCGHEGGGFQAFSSSQTAICYFDV